MSSILLVEAEGIAFGRVKVFEFQKSMGQAKDTCRIFIIPSMLLNECSCPGPRSR
jgi:hypothetical protein